MENITPAARSAAVVRTHATGPKTGFATIVTVSADAAIRDIVITPEAATYFAAAFCCIDLQKQGVFLNRHDGYLRLSLYCMSALPGVDCGQPPTGPAESFAGLAKVAFHQFRPLHTLQKLSNFYCGPRITAAGAGINPAETRPRSFTARPDNFTGIRAVLTGNLHKICFAGAVIPHAGNSGWLKFPHALAVKTAIKTAVPGKTIAVGISAAFRIKVIKDPIPHTIAGDRSGAIGTGCEISIRVIENRQTAGRVDARIAVSRGAATAWLIGGLQDDAARGSRSALAGLGQNHFTGGVEL